MCDNMDREHCTKNINIITLIGVTMRYLLRRVKKHELDISDTYEIYDHCLYKIEFNGTFKECIVYLSTWVGVNNCTVN